MLNSRDNRSSSKVDRVLAEVIARQERGEHIDVQDLLREHHDIAETLRSYFASAKLFDDMLEPRDDSRLHDSRLHDSRSDDSRSDWCLNGASDASQTDAEYLKNNATRVGGSSSDLRAESNPRQDLSFGRIRLGEMFGRYRIERLLGDGGMGAVYLANDTLLNRPVALKTPKFVNRRCASLIERFRREAQAAAKLHHRNICPIHDVGQHGGTDYLTMAYIEGKPLSDYISGRKHLDQCQVALIIRRLALALQAAHEAGVVHRDLKPSNVMIDPKGEPILMDFGLASRMESSEDSRLTASGSIVGTPAYMSPEQVRGARDEIGPQSDVYSLGVMFYELLTGRLPFRGSAAEIMGKVLIAKPRSLQDLRPDIDDQIAGVCERMMSKSRAARFSSMMEVADELTNGIRRLRSDTTPAPPVVNDRVSHAESAGNTAAELAAIAAEATKHSRHSGGSRRKDHEGSRREFGARSGLTRLQEFSRVSRVPLGVSIGVVLALAALCLILLSTIEPDGDTHSNPLPGEESTATLSAVPVKEQEGKAAEEDAEHSDGLGNPDPDALAEIYKGFSIDNPNAGDTSFLVGSPVPITFDLANTADIDSANQLMDTPASLGFVRLWIASRDEAVALPGLGIRDHSRYLLNAWDVEASEFSRMRGTQTYQREIGTDAFPAGTYQCSVEYISPDESIIRQAFVDFELREATPPPVPSPQIPDTESLPAPPNDLAQPIEEPEPVIAPPGFPLGEAIGQIVLGGGPRPPPLPPPAWRVAPPTTKAICVVDSMEDYSHKLDSIAELMGIDPPNALPYGMARANITRGLKRDGTLMWLVGDARRGQWPVAYLLPSTSHHELISGMRPTGPRDIKDVIVEGANYKTREMEDYSGFALNHRHHVAWLSSCASKRKHGPGFDRTLGSLSDFLQRQDIGFAMTREFIEKDGSLRLPFSEADHVIPASMKRVADDLFELTGFQAVAGGTSIEPGRGVAVSLAATIDAKNDMKSWSETMSLDRDDLVATLPGGPAAFVIGVASCQQWNDWLEQLLKKGCRDRFGENGDRMMEHIALRSLKGATLMVSANPGVPAREISRQIHLQVHVEDAAQAMDGFYTFLKHLEQALEKQDDGAEMLSGLDVAKVDVDGQEIITFDVKLSLQHRDALAFVFSVTPLNQNTLVVQGGEPDQIGPVLTQSDSHPLHHDPNIASTLDMIPADAQQIILFNAGHASNLAQQFALAAMPVFDAPAAPPKDLVKPEIPPKNEGAAIHSEHPGNPPRSLQTAVLTASLESLGNLQPTSLIIQGPLSLFSYGQHNSRTIQSRMASVKSAIAATAKAGDQHARIARQLGDDPLTLLMKLQTLRDTSPVGVGNRFGPSHVELRIVATEDLLQKLGELDPFESLQEMIRQTIAAP